MVVGGAIGSPGLSTGGVGRVEVNADFRGVRRVRAVAAGAV